MSTNASITISPGNGYINVSWTFTTYLKEDKGLLNCYIPSFGIYFHAKDETQMGVKAKVLTKMFFDNYLLHSGEKGFRRMILQIHKCGFKAPNDNLTIKNLLNHKINRAKFSDMKSIIPSEFNNANTSINESNLQVALES